jgi:hypothetical protein
MPLDQGFSTTVALDLKRRILLYEENAFVIYFEILPTTNYKHLFLDLHQLYTEDKML